MRNGPPHLSQTVLYNTQRLEGGGVTIPAGRQLPRNEEWKYSHKVYLKPKMDKYRKAEKEMNKVANFRVVAMIISFISMLFLFLPLSIPAVVLAFKSPALTGHHDIDRLNLMRRYKISLGLAIGGILIGIAIVITLSFVIYDCMPIDEFEYRIDMHDHDVEPESFHSYGCFSRWRSGKS